MRLAPKIGIFATVIFLLISFGLVWFVYSITVLTLEKDTMNNLEESAFHAMDKVDRMIFERNADIQTFADDQVISSPTSTPEEITERLIEYRNRLKTYVSLSFFDMNMIRIADTSGLDIGRQLPPVGYEGKAVESGKPVMDVSLSPSLKRPVIHFAALVKSSQGRPLGVVVSRVPIEKLHEILKVTSGMHEDEQGLEIDLIDKVGLVLFSNHAPSEILKARVHNWETIRQRIGDGKAGSFRFNALENGKSVEVINSFVKEQGFLNFRGNGWTLLLHLPVETAFAPAIQLRSKVIVILLISDLLGTAAIAFFAYKIVRPIKKLQQATQKISRGDLEVIVDLNTKDEIGELATSFNVMAGDLNKSRNELLKHSLELENARSSLDESNKELASFAYVVSHDLKAPLRAITSLSNWLAADYADKLDKEGQETLDLIVQRAKRMDGLINGILNYSRVGRSSEVARLVELETVVKDAITLVSPPEHVMVTVETKLPIIMCEQTRIYQLFQNLISNAVKYMDKPKGEIRVGCVDDGRLYTFYVSDNGPGIEEQYFDKIFQMFQTLNPRDEVESTGVGLTIVKKIVEMYGGTIWVESKIGEGATFRFTLPYTAGEGTKAADVGGASKPGAHRCAPTGS